MHDRKDWEEREGEDGSDWVESGSPVHLTFACLSACVRFSLCLSLSYPPCLTSCLVAQTYSLSAVSLFGHLHERAWQAAADTGLDGAIRIVMRAANFHSLSLALQSLAAS